MPTIVIPAPPPLNPFKATSLEIAGTISTPSGSGGGFYNTAITKGFVMDVAGLAAAMYGGDLGPYSDNSYSLGSTSRRWYQAFLGTNTVGTNTSVGYGALFLSNPSAAAAGAQQYSPFAQWEGQGWSTNGGGASMSVKASLQLRPVQGAAAPTGMLDINWDINGGGVSTKVSFDSAGGVYAVTIGNGANQHTIPTSVASTLAVLGIAQTFTKNQRVARVDLGAISATTVATDANLSSNFAAQLTGACTLGNPTNLVAGDVIIWDLVNSSGTATLAYGNLFKFPGGTVPTLSTGASARDKLTGYYNGTTIDAVMTQAFA